MAISRQLRQSLAVPLDEKVTILQMCHVHWVGATVLFAAITLAQAPSASTRFDQASETDSVSLEPTEAPEPAYPEKALRKNIAGHVLVQILVSETGKVEATQIIKGDAALKDAAENAAKGWKFKPFLKGGIVVPAIAILNFRFGDDENNNSQSSASSAKVGVTIENARPMTSKVRVAQGVMQGLQIRKVNPAYPEAARSGHIQGSIVMQVIIDREGKIRDVNVISGPPELSDAAVLAVRQWQYKPFFIMGRPVEVETQIVINFNLN
jgi:TonB family protein